MGFLLALSVRSFVGTGLHGTRSCGYTSATMTLRWRNRQLMPTGLQNWQGDSRTCRGEWSVVN